MAQKLKGVKMTSVDLVKRGANQEADIALYKSADYGEMGPIEKSVDRLDFYNDTLSEAFYGIMKSDISDEEKQELLQKSLREYSETVSQDIIKACGKKVKKEDDPYDYYEDDDELDFPIKPTKKKESEDDMKIDKSLLTPEEAKTLDHLLAKAAPEEKKKPPFIPAKDEEEDEEMNPAIKKALEDLDVLKKNYEMKEIENVAKKYEVLGQDSAKLTETLYNLKKSGEANYNAYTAVLDQQLDLVTKGGLFSEIGKSAGYGGAAYGMVSKSGAQGKIEAIAKKYVEADPAMSYEIALGKAWEENPEIAMEYENERRGR